MKSFKKNFLIKIFTTQKGSVELCYLLMSSLMLFCILKSIGYYLKTLEDKKHIADLILCAKEVSLHLQKNIDKQVIINKTILVLKWQN